MSSNITAAELVNRVELAANPAAVVCVCVDGFVYSPVSEVIDESQPAAPDGSIGVVLLKLDPASDVDRALRAFDGLIREVKRKRQLRSHTDLTRPRSCRIHVDGEWGVFFVQEDYKLGDDDRETYGAVFCANTSFGVYGHWWSSMGQPFAKFAQGLSEDYLLGKIGAQVVNGSKVCREVRRLIRQARREKRITPQVAADALDDVEEIESEGTEGSGEVVVDLLYRSAAISQVGVEWCDLSTKEWDAQSLGFVRKLWPEFIKQLAE